MKKMIYIVLLVPIGLLGQAELNTDPVRPMHFYERYYIGFGVIDNKYTYNTKEYEYISYKELNKGGTFLRGSSDQKILGVLIIRNLETGSKTFKVLTESDFSKNYLYTKDSVGDILEGMEYMTIPPEGAQDPFKWVDLVKAFTYKNK